MGSLDVIAFSIAANEVSNSFGSKPSKGSLVGDDMWMLLSERRFGYKNQDLKPWQVGTC
jgi:hypothetical protein